MSHIHLIRHGRVDASPDLLTGRAPGYGLHDTGRQQVQALANHLHQQSLPIQQILASPLQRTQETASILASTLNVGVVTEPQLIEFDFGAWSGRKFEEFDQEPEWERFNTQRSRTRAPHGELMQEVQQRVVGVILSLQNRPEDTHWILVSHGDVIRAALLWFLGMPIDFYARLRIDLASWSSIELTPSQCEVYCINQRVNQRFDVANT